MSLKVSIITVSYNSEKTIEETIISVLNQDHQNIEYIIIDGESNDNTLAIINRYREKIDIVISEKDAGIYDAMNKGIAQSSGHWIWFMGTGDVPLDGAVNTIIEKVKSCDQSDLHAFCVELAPPLEPGVPPFYKPIFSSALKWRNTLHHQGLLYKKSSISNLLYDTRFKVLADYHLNLRLWKNGASCICHDITVTRVDSGGVSRTFNKQLYKEERELKRDVFGGGLSGVLQGVWTRIKYLNKQAAKI